MDLVFRAGVLLVLFSSPAASANEPDINAVMGRGLVCDTPGQLEQFAGFRNRGQDIDTAIGSVNDEAHNPIACGILDAAFTVGKTIAHLGINGKLICLVEITITTMRDGSVWMKVPATVQYTIVAETGEAPHMRPLFLLARIGAGTCVMQEACSSWKVSSAAQHSICRGDCAWTDKPS